jgi:hypothetical protein
MFKHPFRFGITLGMTALIAVIVTIAGALILVNGSIQPELAIQASTHHLRDIAVLLLLPLILAVILAYASKADRRCSDDFGYQLLAAGAMVGMFTMMIASVVWSLDFLSDEIGIRGMRGQDQMAVGMIGWGVAYFTFRIRGLK